MSDVRVPVDQLAVKKHLKGIKRQLYKNLFASYRGWWQWHKIVKRKGVGNTAVILLPTCDREINRLALLYLDDMLTSRKYTNAVVLTHDPAVLKCAALFPEIFWRQYRLAGKRRKI